MSYGGECFGVTVFPVMGDADGRAITLIIVALLCVLYLTNAHKQQTDSMSEGANTATCPTATGRSLLRGPDASDDKNKQL